MTTASSTGTGLGAALLLSIILAAAPAPAAVQTPATNNSNQDDSAISTAPNNNVNNKLINTTTTTTTTTTLTNAPKTGQAYNATTSAIAQADKQQTDNNPNSSKYSDTYRNDTTTGWCSFGFGICGYVDSVDAVSKLPVPCKYDGPPKVIQDYNLLRRFDELCPSLNVLDNQDKGLCCDQEQVQEFVSSIQRAKDILGNCPSCFINFAQLFCDLTCNPHQATFAKVTKSSPYSPPPSTTKQPSTAAPNVAFLPLTSADNTSSTTTSSISSTNVAISDTPKEAVETINYTLSSSVVDGLYSSCKDVIWTQAQIPALSVLCGDKCTPKELVEHLGQKGTAPFDIDYLFVNTSHYEPISCNSSVGERYPRLKNLYRSRCSYSDCPSEPQPIPQPDTPWIVKIGGVYVLVTFLFIVLAALISVIYDHYGEYDHFLIDSVLSKMFRRWALFCSQYATLVILFGLAGVTLSCVGLTKLQIITDPVNLWSQANSRAHQEKIYFENTFGPFYRVEQVIVYPTQGARPWLPFNGDTNRTFSSVFEPSFLKSALKLQHSILNLKAQYDDHETVDITDICVQPLNNSICSVQSPLDWFQGKEENFHFNETIDRSASSSSSGMRRSILASKISHNSSDTSLRSHDSNHPPQPAYLKHFNACFKNSLEPQDPDFHKLPCLGPYGGPIFPHIGLGGYPGSSYWQANSLVITIPVRNKHEITRHAKVWERQFIDLLMNYKDPNLRLAFYSERSIEDEIERQSQSDVLTIAISYLVMFAYVAMSLGKSSASWRGFLIESRIVLGLGGVLIVLASVLASIGILSFFGVSATLIIIEVIPFLVLAVGVDNIFIIVQALQRSAHTAPRHTERSVEEQISIVVGDVAPSLLLASLSESACFLIGSLTPMPAVRVFAMTASLALFVDFVLQTTVFIGLLTLDTKRQLAGRYDLICCLTASKASPASSLIGPADVVGPSRNIQANAAARANRPEAVVHPPSHAILPIAGNNNDGHQAAAAAAATPMTSPNNDDTRERYSSESINAKFIPRDTDYYDPLYNSFESHIAPFLMRPAVRAGAMVVFLAWLCLSLSVIHKIDVGLDQTQSVPDDSYMQDYFNAQRADLRVGPPVFFVLKRGLDFSNPKERNTVCSSSGCHDFSLVSHISQASRISEASYIATPSNSWIDDYRAWGANDKCCRMFKNPPRPSTNATNSPSRQQQGRSSTALTGAELFSSTTLSPPSVGSGHWRYRQRMSSKFCPNNEAHKEDLCQACDLVDRNVRDFDPEHFYEYLEDFLGDTPNTDCISGGAAVYSDLVNISRSFATTSGPQKVWIDSAFSSYHVPLKDSSDFIEAMKSARAIAQNIEDMLNANLRSQQTPSLQTLAEDMELQQPSDDTQNQVIKTIADPQPQEQPQEKLEVFPYCFTYVFYEQYLTIWQQTFRNLSISMATIFVVTYLLLGCDLYISAVVVGTIASIVINLMGLMYFWNIQLNAISLVNLVMAVGISVEFCSHIARAFALSQKNKPSERSQEALVKMGSSVLSGITLTKVAGISILAFAKSKIFKVYYFRMYMGIVLVGALHGIIFMPIIMSLTARERRPAPRQAESDDEVENRDSLSQAT